MQRPWIIASAAYGGPHELPADGPARVATADWTEVRLDAIGGGSGAAVGLCRAVADWGRPLLLTPRRHAEGGQRHWTEDERLTFLRACWGEVTPAAVDVEVRGDPALVRAVSDEAPPGTRVIASYHDFHQMPAEALLDALAEEAVEAGADYFKVAARAESLADTARLACWTQTCRRIGVISMAMGEAGVLSRVMNGAFGSAACYGHIEQVTAPGQLPVDELAALVEQLYPSDC